MFLTDVKIRNTRPVSGKRLELSDGHGLTLRVSPDGRKSWSVTYRVARGGDFDPDLGRNRAGAKRRMTLGYWPAVSLAEARAAALLLRAKALGGSEPRPTSNEQPSTVKALITAYCDTVKVKLVSEKRRLLQNYVEPKWGRRDLTGLSRGELAQLLQPLAPSRQFGVRKHVVAMFNWAADHGFVTANPFAGMRLKIAMKARERALTLGEAQEVFAAAGKLGYPFGAMYQLLLLSGCRLREIASARRDWLQGDELIIPGSERKNGRPHVVPLSSVAAEVVRSLPSQDGPHLFSTTDGARPVSGFSKAKKQLDKLLPSDFPPFVIHDLRRTVRTQMSRAGVDPMTAELVLGHQLSGLLGVYDRYERLTEREAALKAWAKILTTT
ncbi:MAG: site-specific integrase [Sphingomicrobium sp.]